jgi:hypothetical protein
MRNDILPVRPGRPEDRRLIKELNEEGQMSQKLSRALQTAAVAGLGILAADDFALVHSWPAMKAGEKKTVIIVSPLQSGEPNTVTSRP